MAQLIYILNGPNLNLLGKRQPEIYGIETLADVEESCKNFVSGTRFNLKFKQTNAEHQLIDWIHEARTEATAIIINAGAFTHTSVAILDALNTFDGIVIEVHISDIKAREKFRHHSYVSLRADKEVIGKGTKGYIEALEILVASEV
ncbi:MAG: 3-dehydroquinate dehydratase [Rhodobacteraceae bacterium]|nr:MAG: 3-dehydroquinate dehydratase [Paracoccaceae bacterium]